MSEPSYREDLARRCAEVMWSDDAASRGLGMHLDSVSPGLARVNMRVVESMVNGHGTCHGGFVAALADSAFAFACNTYDDATVAAGFDIVFVTAAHLGDELVADAVERVRRGRSGVYDVTVTRTSGASSGPGEVSRPGEPAIVAEFRGRSRSLGKPILKR